MRVDSEESPNSMRKELVGPKCESVIDVSGHKCKCLIDTGSQVSTISEFFFTRYLQHYVELQNLNGLISIEVAGGHRLPYIGYVNVPIRLPKGELGSRKAIDVLLLVVKDTNFNNEVPALLGTNILKYVLDLCNKNLNSRFEFRNLMLRNHGN